MEYETAGDPITGLKWTRKITEKVAKELRSSGINITSKTVGRLLRKLNFSLRVNHKKVTNSNVSPDDRNQQFEIIASLREEFANKGNPIISVDTKKKEKIGNFKNEGSAWTHMCSSLITSRVLLDNIRRFQLRLFENITGLVLRLIDNELTLWLLSAFGDWVSS